MQLHALLLIFNNTFSCLVTHQEVLYAAAACFRVAALDEAASLLAHASIALLHVSVLREHGIRDLEATKSFFMSFTGLRRL